MDQSSTHERKHEDDGSTVSSYFDKQYGCIETISESVSDEEWINLLSTPLPQCNPQRHNKAEYKRAVSKIEELRTAARVKSALLIADKSGEKHNMKLLKAKNCKNRN